MEKTQIPDWLSQVGEGWGPILTKLHEEILNLDADYSVGQIKEKFGGLRAYLRYAAENGSTINELVNAAERLSEITCEVCGAPGEVRGKHWLKCVCPEHDREGKA